MCLSLIRSLHISLAGESISNGKDAKQSSTDDIHVASRALDISYLNSGSLTARGNLSWWDLDLRGYFTISNITLTARNSTVTHMTNAYVEVADKDISLCSDVQAVWCGAVPHGIAPGEKVTFTCNGIAPVRFVRVTRRSPNHIPLAIGHVDVQGEGATKPYRSHYKPSPNKKMLQPFLATSATTVGDCGIVCHKHHSCIDFSYSATAPTDDNCLLTDKALTSVHIKDNSWTTYTIYCI
ncbi:uncharacterized protein [Haliotis asinina]|uniref:uncharacterized protein n=1 Tax=Haliotis asinina TaxID=109174 RepID=UPI0035317EF5